MSKEPLIEIILTSWFKSDTLKDTLKSAGNVTETGSSALLPNSGWQRIGSFS